jgi:hypothetical protein
MTRLWLFGLVALCFHHSRMIELVQGKVVSGTAKVTGAKSENTISKFAFSPGGVSTIQGVFETEGMYVDERELRVYIYSDDNWNEVKKASTCRAKVRLSRMSKSLTFDLVKDRLSGRQRGQVKPKEKYIASFDVNIDQQAFDGPKYWYITVADCSLEQYSHDSEAPEIHYQVTIMDEFPKGQYTHLPSDEQGMQALNLFNLLLSGLLGAGLLLRALVLIKQRNEIHFALFIVLVACVMSAAGSLCELVHLQVYRRNGVGSYTFDALSAHLEALTDAFIALLLLAVAVGWTLPSDINIRVDQQGAGSGLVHILEGLRNPASAIQRGSPSGILSLLLVATHSILAQWGRMYDDDFDCYHDLEHPPGKALFLLRAFLGFCFLLGVAALRRSSHCSPALQQFLIKFALIGITWFLSLPSIAVVSSNLIPPHRRHQVVSAWAVMVQFCSLASLAWLFAADSSASAYHGVSKVGGSNSDSLGSDSSSVTTKIAFKLGKTKVRID